MTLGEFLQVAQVLFVVFGGAAVTVSGRGA